MGGDLFYEMANLAAAKRDTVFDTSNKLNNLQAGVRLGYELVIGKFCAIASGTRFLMTGDHKLDAISTYPFIIFQEGWEEEY